MPDNLSRANTETDTCVHSPLSSVSLFVLFFFRASSLFCELVADFFLPRRRFWVACFSPRSKLLDFLHPHPMLKRAAALIPPPIAPQEPLYGSIPLPWSAFRRSS
jgi:hypothetical protein